MKPGIYQNNFIVWLFGQDVLHSERQSPGTGKCSVLAGLLGLILNSKCKQGCLENCEKTHKIVLVRTPLLDIGPECVRLVTTVL